MPMSVVRRRLLAGLIGLAALTALAVIPSPVAAEEPAKLPVVASFSILGDFVARIGGERVAVTTLVGPGGDAHVFEPTPADAKALQGARVVVVNGLGFEGWAARLVKASGTKASVVVASTGVTARAAAEDDHDDHGKGKHADHDHGKAKHGGHDHGAVDPHAWQSVANALVYVTTIRDGLIAADPVGRETYLGNAARYAEELTALEAEVRAAVASVPPGRRRVITSHDAFGYFSDAYGIQFLAPRGISTDAEPTAKAVAGLIRQIRAEKITAVFVETMTDGRLVERIAKETGVRVGGELYADALSPKGGPAPTYVDMVRHNVKLLTAAMIGS